MKADAAALPSNALSITLNAAFSTKDTPNLAKRNFFSKESLRQTWTYGTRCGERKNGSICRNILHRRMRYRVPPNASLSRPTFYARGCAWTAARGRPLPPPALMRARVRFHSNVTIGDIYARPSAREGAPPGIPLECGRGLRGCKSGWWRYRNAPGFPEWRASPPLPLACG